MKRNWLIFFCCTTALLAGCGESNENTTSDNEDDNNGTETSDNNSNEDSSVEDMTTEEILNEAIDLYNSLESLYIESEGTGDVDLSLEEEEINDESAEEFDDTDLELNINTRQWTFIKNNDVYDRTETEIKTEVESDDNSESEEVTSYSFTDYNDTSYMIMYDEGDSEATRIESDMDFDFSMMAQEYEDLLDNAELTLIGEEEVNGYQAYHIEAEVEGELRSYWFDQDSFFNIRLEIEEGHGNNDSEYSGHDDIINFELNPEFDESLFQIPEEVEVLDS